MGRAAAAPRSASAAAISPAAQGRHRRGRRAPTPPPAEGSGAWLLVSARWIASCILFSRASFVLPARTVDASRIRMRLAFCSSSGMLSAHQNVTERCSTPGTGQAIGPVAGSVKARMALKAMSVKG